MKTAAILRFVVVAVIAVLVVGGSTAAWADCALTSPNFTADFASNEDCLMLNGNALFHSNDSTVLRLTEDQAGQVGSAWFNVQQPVKGGFSTAFQFQFTREGVAHTPADGIAFVIQNSSLSALGQGGGSIGYADGGCDAPPCKTGGIPNSLAIEFDTFNNDSATDDPNANHIAVQSCGLIGGVPQPNSNAHGENSPFDFPVCLIGSVASPGTTMSDGNPHIVVINYTPPSCTIDVCLGTLTVNLDGHNVLTTSVTLENELNLNDGGKAWVGFTSATGAAFENHDILSWTFKPEAQSATITNGGPAAILNFNGGPANGAYEYDAQLDNTDQNPASVVVQVKPIPIDEEACEQLVDANPKFGHAQCFVYKNADGLGNDSALLFELTCPGFTPDDACGSATQKFFATLGTVFTFDKAENEGFHLLASTIGPYPGWLKGDGGVAGSPCTPNPDNVTPLFQSNQITSFSVVGDPTGTTKGKSGGGGSCWVATYATGGELPPGIKITSPTFKTYTQSSTPGVASYTCSNPKTSQNSLTSAVGPYLTVATCAQSQVPNPNQLTQTSCTPGQPCTGKFDLSVKGVHAFQVTSKDTGGNVNINVVLYNVK